MLNIALAQINPTVGAIDANQERIVDFIRQAQAQKADVVIFPELALCGYPPEDLLFRTDFLDRCQQALVAICAAVDDIAVILGYPEPIDGCLYNSAAVIRHGKIIVNYRKKILPNFGVFDEQRYFTAGQETALFSIKGTTLALTICEDIWQTGLIETNKRAGADCIVTLNASPFHIGKTHLREQVIGQQVRKAHIPLVYVNLVGGQDELIFDGASFVMDHQGQVTWRAEEFKEQLALVTFDQHRPLPSSHLLTYTEVSSEYQALVLGVRDYVHKNGFKGALLGLSGGIDSALVLAIAVDALGADQVEAVLLPSRYTRDISNEDAIQQAQTLGVQYHTVPIEPAVEAFNQMLSPLFTGTQKDTTEENIQARCRGVVLMALSNKQGKLLLTTGNKSEMSVGYATLYGDMAGGFAPIKDVPKLLVYRLAQYRNTLSPVIPERVLERPPSAELAPDQVDEDSLPSYAILDPILERYIEQDQSATDIEAAGFAGEDVQRAIRLVDRNEYKRRQSPPGIKITSRAFGRDRRYPITSGFKGV